MRNLCNPCEEETVFCYNLDEKTGRSVCDSGYGDIMRFSDLDGLK